MNNQNFNESTDLKEFKDASPLVFGNDDECVALEMTFTNDAPSWAGKFTRVFNGEFKSFKTFDAFKKDALRLMAKFDLSEDAEMCEEV